MDKLSRITIPITDPDSGEIENKTFNIAGNYEDLNNKPSLGSAAEKNIPEDGDASEDEVVLGNDTRLTDARNAKDVPQWAKEPNKPAYNATEIAYDSNSDVNTQIGNLYNLNIDLNNRNKVINQRISDLSMDKQDKGLEGPILIDGHSESTVEGAIQALADKVNKNKVVGKTLYM